VKSITDAVAHFFQKKLARPPAGNSNEIVRIANLIQRHAGISEYSRHLGDGSFGSAFLVDDTLVLKLTNDFNEVHASYAVRKAGLLANVVEIEYAGIALGGTAAIGVIVSEFMPEIFAECFPQSAITLATAVVAIKEKHGVWSNQLDTLSPAKARLRLKKAQADLTKMLSYEHNDRLDQVILGLLQLRDVGVYYVDCHPKNVGVLRGDGEEVIKLFDLGVSSVSAGTKAPTIEATAVAGLGEPAICKRQRIHVMS
jgi:hypothetical protein